MNNYALAYLDILTGILLWLDLVFMGFTLFYFEKIWLFLISLALLFLFVYLRNVYNDFWYREVGYVLGYPLEGVKRK